MSPPVAFAWSLRALPDTLGLEAVPEVEADVLEADVRVEELTCWVEAPVIATDDDGEGASTATLLTGVSAAGAGTFSDVGAGTSCTSETSI